MDMGISTDRWAWLRYLPTPVEASAPSEEISCPVKVLDLSQAGIRVILPQRVPVGAVLTLDLLLAPEKFGRTLFARIIHIQAKKARTWITECDFLKRLSPEELDALLRDSVRPSNGQDQEPTAPVPAAASNRRGSARRPARADIACWVAGHGDQGRLPATIVNISNGGVCLRVGARFEAGESLQIAFASARGGFTCTERAVIRHALLYAADIYQLGCEFTKGLTHGDLAALTR
jgi:hypothetical protein